MHTPNASYVPFVAGQKRKDPSRSAEPICLDSASDTAAESGDDAAGHRSSTEGGPVRAVPAVGHYVQVSSSSPKPDYKDRIFRVFSVGKEASTLEYLDDQEPAKKPNIRNRFLLIPNSSAINLHEYENLNPFRCHPRHGVLV